MKTSNTSHRSILGLVIIAMLANKFQEFKQGFTDTLNARVGMEPRLATTYQENQRKYLNQNQPGTQK